MKLTNAYGFKVECIAHSVAHGIQLVTLALRYPRFIHAELMTHRMFSRNASSSRAIPVSRILTEVRTNPAMPVHWGQNQAGMQAGEEIPEDLVEGVSAWWRVACSNASVASERLSEIGVHKQITNRLTEPFQFINVLVTATEWDNFFALRLHPAAQPEFQELARMMRKAIDLSSPRELLPGEWHLPYADGLLEPDLSPFVSAGRCARVSYKNHDGSYADPAEDACLAGRLLKAGHMSPFEHQATPMFAASGPLNTWEAGVTHVDRWGDYWSGNFRGWVQHRQIIA